MWQDINGINQLYRRAIVELEMDIPKTAEQDNSKDPTQDSKPPQEILNDSMSKSDEPLFRETRYRWAVLALTGTSLLLNGLINHAIVPIEHKMTILYEVSEQQVSLSIVITFIVFFLINFPATRVIERKGLRFSLCLGTGLQLIAAGLFLLINQSYYFVILGGFFIGLGQPFLINSSAKVATFWFFPRNRSLATAVLVALNLLGLGMGFLIPTIVTDEQKTDDNQRHSILYLYLTYFIGTAGCFVLNLLFMQSKPQALPSEGALLSKLYSFTICFKELKRNSNFWIFLAIYCVNFGTLISFIAHSNFIMKPYGYSDQVVAFNIVMLMIMGTIGSIIVTFYLKKYPKYKNVILTLVLANSLFIILLCVNLNTLNNSIATTVIVSSMGFFGIPVVPISYQLGCQLAFPIGQAMITGFLNAGAFFWAFTLSAFVSLIFGFDSKNSSMVIMILLSALVLLSALSFFFVEIHLKRSQMEKQQDLNENFDMQEIDKKESSVEKRSDSERNYSNLVEEGEERNVGMIRL